MDEKVVLYASWAGRWSYGKDRAFIASKTKTERCSERFVVSRTFILQEVDDYCYIDERSDAVFLDG